MPEPSIRFTSSVERDKDGTWWFAHVPKTVRAKLKDRERRGHTAVRVTIGQTSWDASIMPWADGSGQITLKKGVRTAEELQLGQRVRIEVVPR